MVGGFVVAMFVFSLFGVVDHHLEHDRSGSGNAGYHTVDK